MIERWVVAYEPDEVISDLWYATHDAGHATREEAEETLSRYPETHRQYFRVYHVLIKPVEDEDGRTT